MPHPAPAHKSFADRNSLYQEITDKIIAELDQGHGLALDQLTPDGAAQLVLRADWHGDRRQYAVFVVRRFAAYLAEHRKGKLPTLPTRRELVRAALRQDYEDYLHRQRGLSERTIGH